MGYKTQHFLTCVPVFTCASVGVEAILADPMGPRGRTINPGTVVNIGLALGPCVAQYTLTGVSPHTIHTGGSIPTRGGGTVICRLQY